MSHNARQFHINRLAYYTGTGIAAEVIQVMEFVGSCYQM
jgi:hypothetical protein